MPASLQRLIHLVQEHVRQKRRERAALRRPLVPLHHHSLDHDPGFQVAADDPEQTPIPNPVCQFPHEHVVVDPVEKLRQIHIDHPPSSLLDVPLCCAHGIVRAAPRPKAVAVLREGRIEERLQDLQQRLLDEAVKHGRNPQLPDPAARLRNLVPPHRLRLVGPREERLADPGPVRSQIRR